MSDTLLPTQQFNLTRVLHFFSLMRAVAAPSTRELSINSGVFLVLAGVPLCFPNMFSLCVHFLTLKSLVLNVVSFKKNFFLH